MKTLKRSITVLVCLILFTSCTKSIDYSKEKSNIEVREEITYYKGTPFTGEIFLNYLNGQLQFKKNYKDGKREDGLYESYYKNGQLMSKTNYKDGKQDGLFESYYINGKLMSKSNWKDGELDGLYESYYKNGKLQFKTNEDGLYESYDKDGKRTN